MFCSHSKKTGGGGVLVLACCEWFDGPADLPIHEHDLLYPCQGSGLRVHLPLPKAAFYGFGI